MSTGKQTPLGVNVMSGMVQGKGFWINPPTAAIVGASKNATDYTPGSIINNRSVIWPNNKSNNQD